ncbi:MAG: hypothetical protein MJ062_05120 [Oscillospiraceae bacterium]|nr:hypothetical protein [Oscillospiraceae bacterium]
MNPTTFSELLTDISDEYIVSAANPHSKPIRWYQVSAIAACIVLLISAAIYPKLRIQTPEITEPPESVEEVITTMTTVQKLAEHSETQTATSPIQTSFASAAVTVNTTANISEFITANETDMPLLSVSSVNTTPTQPQKSIEKAETEPIITTHTHAVTTSPITSDEPTIQSDEPIVSQIIAIPIYRTEVQPLTTSITPNEISCYFYDPTADIISEFENLPDDLDLSNCTLICAEISGDIQNAAIIRGKIINDICQLYIAYLNENDTLDNVQIKYLLVFPNELNIKSDQLSANIIPVIGEDFFQILLEESSQSITIQY